MPQDEQVNEETAPVTNRWSANTKLLVGGTLIALVAFLLARFNNIIGPLLFAFVLAYLFRPLANAMVNRLKLKWGAAVAIVYLMFFLVMIGFLTVTGVALVQEAQNLVGLLTDFLDNLPALIEDLMNSDAVYQVPLTNESVVVGEFISNLNIDLPSIIEQTLGVLQPMLGQAGSLVGTIASSAVSFVGWFFFILFTSFFMLSEAGQFPNLLGGLENSGATDELERLLREANRLWNAYLRGQLLVSFILGFAYFVFMLVLGVKNALVLGILAGLSSFVPYAGQVVMVVIIAVSSFLQPDNYMGLPPISYALIVTVVIFVSGQLVDGIVTPSIFSSALGVHPAALMVAAIVAANLLGFVGLLLAAPVLAAGQLTLHYVFRKMVDLDPWPHPEPEPVDMFASLLAVPKNWVINIRKMFKRGKRKNG